MRKTLADMTETERQACVGMWCEIANIFGVITYIDVRSMHQVNVFTPLTGEWYCNLNEVTPRFDLPRAWTPQGTPTPGEWENGEATEINDANPYSDEAIITGQETEQEYAIPSDEWDKHVTTTYADKYERDGKSRRFITQWEPT